MLNEVDVLFELGTEELPSGSVNGLAEALLKAIQLGLDKQGLSYHSARCYATPRRLAVRLSMDAMQRDQPVTRRGPAMSVGSLPDGTPTEALLGFAKSCGVDVSLLTTLETDKGRWWVYDTIVSGQSSRELLPSILQKAVLSLPIAKPMRWGLGEMTFVRPVHWIVLLFNDEVIDLELLGCRAGRLSFGHRFHHPHSFSILSPSHYEDALKKAYVIPDFDARRSVIKHMILDRAAEVHCQAVMPDALLDEVTSIVEWPNALLAHFDEAFLEVPSEALIAAMQVHQKCFALRDANGALSPHFITVSNIESNDPSQVIHGNERVMGARLSDAAFFYQQDRKRALSDYAASTATVLFQEKLGSLAAKALRIEKLITYCVPYFNLNGLDANRAAALCKCDLMTAMVGEFPELEGLMGYYYATHDGESKAVAIALKEQYLPRFSADDLPCSPLGVALSLVDRLDTLAGAFAVGLKPTAVKDPFKLRRHALAVIRLLRDRVTPEPLYLSDLLSQALKGYQGKIEIPPDTHRELMQFILDRLPSSYSGETVGASLILAVRARESDWLFDFHQRILAMHAFLKQPEAVVLAAACKRVNHLLQHVDLRAADHALDEALLENESEKKLFMNIKTVQQVVTAHSFPAVSPTQREYEYILTALAGLRESVDLFFEHVMVMVEDQALQINRLCLLAQLQALLQCVADLSMISSTGKS
jgi:glycyl-tRNA synthetase beta chain